MPKNVNMAKKESKKVETKIESATTPTMDFEKIIADALAKQEQKLRLEFEAKLQETKKVQVAQSIETIIEPIKENKIQVTTVQKHTDKKLNIRNRKFVPDEARIRIESNVSGKFVISDTRGKTYFTELNGYGYTTTISFRELKNFHGNNHSFLNSGKLIITDVISDVDVTLDDVIEDFNLQKIYHNEDMIRPFEIEYYLSNDISIDVFNKKLEKSNDVMEVILEVAVILFKRGEFSDNSKMNKLREITRMPELFTR